MTLSIYLLCTIVTLINAQWGPIVKLSTNEVDTRQNENMGQCLAIVGNTLHVVWYDTISPKEAAIFYKRSLDGGKTWGNDTRLSPASVIDGDPLLAACGSSVHVVFWRNPYNTFNGISPPSLSYYKRSTDGGSTWEPEMMVATNVTFWPGLACSGNYVYISLNTQVTADSEVFFLSSSNNGASFNPRYQISNKLNGRSEDPSMTAFGNHVYIVWNDNRLDLTNLQLYYRHSADNGQTWGPETALSALPMRCYSPTVCANGNSVIAMMDNRSSQRIASFRSTNGGATFSPPIEIESIVANTGYPLIAIDQNNVHVTFGVIRGVNNYYLKSSDGGVTWSPPQIIATWPVSAPFLSGPTFVAVSGTVVHLSWSMLVAPGHNAIFYTNNPTGNLGVKDNHLG